MMEVVEEDCGLTDDLKLWCLQLRILIKHWATSCLEILLDPPPPTTITTPDWRPGERYLC